MKKTTLYRPVNSLELELIKNSNWKKFPTRLKEQPIFYPVLNSKYAKDISAWNKSSYGKGFILEFDINSNYLEQFEIHNVGKSYHNEYWIPAEELENFNNQIVGNIRFL